MATTPNASPHAKKTLLERWKALENLPAFLALVWATSRGMTLAIVALRLLRAVMPVVQLFVAKLILDEVVRVAALDSPPADFEAWLASGQLSGLIALLGLELGLAIVSDVLGRVVVLLDGLLSERVTNELGLRLLRHAATLDLAAFEDSEIQDSIERARRQTMGRLPLLGQLFSQAQDAITVISFGAGLVAYAPWLMLLLGLALVPAFIGEAHFNALGYAINFERTPERRELDYVRQLGATVESAKEVKIFGLYDFLAARYRGLAQRLYASTRSLAGKRALWGGLLTSIGTLGYYVAYAVLAWRTVRGDYSIGDLSFLAGSFLKLRNLLEGLLSGFSTVAAQALALEDLFGFFRLRPRIVSPPEPRPFPEPIRVGFVFEGVGFRYPNSEVWALRDLSFTLHADEVLALVGENGAGKTTLVKLLARLYDPDEGRILLDGYDLKEYAVDDLRDHLGVIFQDFVRYHMSAAENIAVGQIDRLDDRARIVAAAQRSQADQVIARLPEGYDQLIGRRFRKGVDLSGGEWQKVAIARAYMADAPVLILDEPTASLDARAEYEVFQRFRELSERKIALLISHRFSNVRMADRILVLDRGRIEEVGTHDELMAARGHYAELFELQAAGYR